MAERTEDEFTRIINKCPLGIMLLDEKGQIRAGELKVRFEVDDYSRSIRAAKFSFRAKGSTSSIVSRVLARELYKISTTGASHSEDPATRKPRKRAKVSANCPVRNLERTVRFQFWAERFFRLLRDPKQKNAEPLTQKGDDRG